MARRSRSPMAATAIGCAVLAVAAVAAPGTAHADAAGPSDYRSEIVAVTPTTDAIDVSIEGGDSFVRVEVEPGHEVIVLGYAPDREPYLRIGPDGTVEQNRRSYATYYNQDRYGRSDIPAVVDTAAPPEWERIGDGGAWSWHDHRAHWMGDRPPIGLEPGRSLPDETIELLVDGDPVDVIVRTTLQEPPSALPPLVGLLIGLQLGLVAVWLGRATATLVLLLAGGGALVVGAGQFLSLSAATGPAFTWWLLPALAVVGAAAAIAVYGRSVWIELGLVGIGAAMLLVWAVDRRAVLTAPVLPTELPFWLDRSVTSASIVVAGGVLVALGRAVLAMATPDESPEE
jgi:hypothetical protein